MRALVLLLVLLPFVAAAQFPPRGSPGEVETQGEELQPALPPFPKDESLVKLSVDALGNFDYFVDPDSVSVGQDGVVRYTLVARAEGGASNIEFEGIRCEDRHRRIYAIGRADKTWAPVQSPRWTTISDLPINTAEAALHDNYFCPGRFIVKDVEEARKALRQGGNPRARPPQS